jgi:hypothetical protein
MKPQKIDWRIRCLDTEISLKNAQLACQRFKEERNAVHRQFATRPHIIDEKIVERVVLPHGSRALFLALLAGWAVLFAGVIYESARWDKVPVPVYVAPVVKQTGITQAQYAECHDYALQEKAEIRQLKRRLRGRNEVAEEETVPDEEKAPEDKMPSYEREGVNADMPSSLTDQDASSDKEKADADRQGKEAAGIK